MTSLVNLGERANVVDFLEVLKTRIESPERIEVMTRGSDEKGPTWGKEESEFSKKTLARNAIDTGSKYAGLEGDLTKSELMFEKADNIYAKKSQKRWEKSEASDPDLIEYGVSRMGDLLQTDYFEKNAKSGAFSEIVNKHKNSENDKSEGCEKVQ